MSVKNFTYVPPTGMQGLEDFFPQELQGPFSEFIRRYQQNNESLINAIRSQCVVDQAVVPTQTSGATDPIATFVATSDDTETAELIGILWEL